MNDIFVLIQSGLHLTGTSVSSRYWASWCIFCCLHGWGLGACSEFVMGDALFASIHILFRDVQKVVKRIPIDDRDDETEGKEVHMTDEPFWTRFSWAFGSSSRRGVSSDGSRSDSATISTIYYAPLISHPPILLPAPQYLTIRHQLRNPFFSENPSLYPTSYECFGGSRLTRTTTWRTRRGFSWVLVWLSIALPLYCRCERTHCQNGTFPLVSSWDFGTDSGHFRSRDGH